MQKAMARHLPFWKYDANTLLDASTLSEICYKDGNSDWWNLLKTSDINHACKCLTYDRVALKDSGETMVFLKSSLGSSLYLYCEKKSVTFQTLNNNKRKYHLEST